MGGGSAGFAEYKTYFGKLFFVFLIKYNMIYTGPTFTPTHIEKYKDNSFVVHVRGIYTNNLSFARGLFVSIKTEFDK